jgi:hypothetical protein
LRASETIKLEGGAEEVFAAGSVAFPPSSRSVAEKLGWSDLGPHSAGPYAFRDHPYKPAEIFQYREGEDLGIDLVFEQLIGNDHGRIWHVNQDLILALNVMQEGDTWVRPDEGYAEVMRQRRDNEGRITAIEIKSEFLRDYLAARGLALRVASYRQRMAVFQDASHIQWPVHGLREEAANDRFCAQTFEVDEDGGRYGGGVALFHAWRTDVDPDEDVPNFGPETSANTDGRTTSYTKAGPKFFRVEGELWREEWIEPAERSERVRGDKPAEIISFVVDASGTREPSVALDNEDVGKYLWFDPRVVLAASGRRGGGHRWYTRDTGSVWFTRDRRTHFGLNRIGLLNVYAYDVAKLPVWQQRIWAGFNVSPEGGVSPELLDAQMKAQPARTTAAEALLPDLLEVLDSTVAEWLATPLFRKHHAVDSILSTVHRFRALEKDGILALSKDLARLIADRIDTEALQKVAAPPKGEKWGSLKSLEKALATLVESEEARALLTPIVAVYELRLGDAHLPSSKVEEAFRLIGIEMTQEPLQQGQKLIETTVMALATIDDAIKSRG